jgi:AcrR family transcriptional regulator
MNVHSDRNQNFLLGKENLVKEEFPDKKAAALQAALELISEQGFHGAPMSQIADRAGIGVGTIYRYFAGKEDLINALYIEIKTRLIRSILRNHSDGLALRDALRQALAALVHYCLEHPAELSFAEQYENSPLITEATREESLRIADPINQLFRQAAEQGILKEIPFEMLAALIYGATISLVKLYRSGALRFDDASLSAGLDAIWDMIERR